MIILLLGSICSYSCILLQRLCPFTIIALLSTLTKLRPISNRLISFLLVCISIRWAILCLPSFQMKAVTPPCILVYSTSSASWHYYNLFSYKFLNRIIQSISKIESSWRNTSPKSSKRKKILTVKTYMTPRCPINSSNLKFSVFRNLRALVPSR